MRRLSKVFRGACLPTNFYVALVTGATKPTPDTNLLGDLTQIAAGKGYSDGGGAPFEKRVGALTPSSGP